MKKADKEMLEAINGLEEAGASVNATKPVEPIRTPKEKKVEVEEENPNAGVVTFPEEDMSGPFVASPSPKPTLDDLNEALNDCGVGYVPEHQETPTVDDLAACGIDYILGHDEPNVAGENPIDIPDTEDKDTLVTKAFLIRKFAQQTKSIYTTSPGTPQERTYGTQSVWNYVIALNCCHIEVKSIVEQPRSEMGSMVIERDVYCHAVLIDCITGKELSKTTMCASTDEDFVAKQKNKLSVAYALAQTRAEERLARMMFGYQVALAGLQPTPAEELDVVDKWWGTKDREI